MILNNLLYFTELHAENEYNISASSLGVLFCLRIMGAYLSPGVSLVLQSIKNLPAVQKTQVQSLGQEDILEKEMATYSSKNSCFLSLFSALSWFVYLFYYFICFLTASCKHCSDTLLHFSFSQPMKDPPDYLSSYRDRKSVV